MNSNPFGIASLADGSTAILPGMSAPGSLPPGPPPLTALPAQTHSHYGPSSSSSSSSHPNSESPTGSSSYTTTSNGHTANSSLGEPTGTGSDNHSPTGIPIAAVPTACLGCRGKHLKCDGQVPCSRCKMAETECVFIASRRGYKGPRKANNNNNNNNNKRMRSQSPPASSTLSVNLGVANGTVTMPPPDSCPMMLGAPRTTFPTPVNLALTTTAQQPLSMGLATTTTGYATTASGLGSLPAGPITFSAAGQQQQQQQQQHMATTATNPSLCAVPSVAASHLHLYKNPFSPSSFLNGGGNNNNNNNMALAIAPPPVVSIADRCLDAFYHYFFASHPFVLPKDVLLSVAKDSPHDTAHLLAAMRYIGSLYIADNSGDAGGGGGGSGVGVGPARAMYFDEAMRLAHLPTCPQNGFLVQTLVLLVVGLDGSCDQERARQLLAEVERLAVDIGLHQRDYATVHGRGSPVMEESWRRTWWDLFVVDGMVAGVHRMTNFWLYDVPARVALPCEEHEYLALAGGTIPSASKTTTTTTTTMQPPAYIEDFDDQLFSGDERAFSSFAYRIAAARILGRFMRCPPMLFPHDENLEKIESMLSNWRMHLPPGKRDDLTKHCQLDEMMFQAHFINHACTILLHQPHSQLDSSPTRSVTSCAPHRHVPSGDNFNTHTRHTITAACEISKMITQAVPLVSHTHFFTCVITLSSIVHLSKWALYYIQDEEDLRQQIRLNIGALHKLSDVWKAAHTASGQVKGVAREIYQAKKAQQINPTFWVGFTQEEMISSINNDEGIMNDFDTILPTSTQ